jgi:hypothetical protein
MHHDSHPSNDELLLAADGELSSRRCARVRAHLTSCWHCRTRMAEIEATIADFTLAYEASHASIPPIAGPRAQLKARLDEISNISQTSRWLGFRSVRWGLAMLAMALLVLIGFQAFTQKPARTGYLALAAPRSSLTPGSIRIVTREDLCYAGAPDRAHSVPTSLRRKVFDEYGMSEDQAGAFEVDYLVTPELGGAEDIRNLWPEPYAETEWNAHVKDALENRLHDLVCSGEIDLATAQHDIATNWILAYKKYFHRDKPFN